MPNVIQKALYNISAGVPLCFVFAIVWWNQKHTYWLPMICIAMGIVLMILFGMSFRYFKENLPPISVRISSVSPNDKWVLAYGISYLMPVASMAIQDFNLILAGAIGCVGILIAPFANSSMPNPILFFMGYHFYDVSTENGMSGYVLITKKKLRNKNNIKLAKRVFEFLLLHEETR